jgi:hypothetical protein
MKKNKIPKQFHGELLLRTLGLGLTGYLTFILTINLSELLVRFALLGVPTISAEDLVHLAVTFGVAFGSAWGYLVYRALINYLLYPIIDKIDRVEEESRDGS